MGPVWIDHPLVALRVGDDTEANTFQDDKEPGIHEEWEDAKYSAVLSNLVLHRKIGPITDVSEASVASIHGR